MLATENRLCVRLRPNSQDMEVFQTVLAGNSYHLPDHFEPTDHIIDVGAHCGLFAVACALRGAGEIDCYEPDEENCQLLLENCDRWIDTESYEGPNIHLVKGAVWGADMWAGDHLIFTGHANGANACGTLIPGACVEGINRRLVVPIHTLNDAIMAALCGNSARVRLLKIDAEGAEYPALYTCTMLDKIDEIVGECHDLTVSKLASGIPIPGFTEQDFTMEGMKRFLERKGFKVRYTRESFTNAINSIFWATR